MACRERGAEPRLVPGPPPLPHKMAPLPRCSAPAASRCSLPSSPGERGVPGNCWGLEAGEGRDWRFAACGGVCGPAVLVLPQMRLELGGWAGAAVVCAGVGEGNGSERGGLQE